MPTGALGRTPVAAASVEAEAGGSCVPAGHRLGPGRGLPWPGCRAPHPGRGAVPLGAGPIRRVVAARARRRRRADSYVLPYPARAPRPAEVHLRLEGPSGGPDGGPDELIVDHVLAATGYRLDVDALDFLAPVRRAVARAPGSKALRLSRRVRVQPAGPVLHRLPRSARLRAVAAVRRRHRVRRPTRHGRSVTQNIGMNIDIPGTEASASEPLRRQLPSAGRGW